MRAALLAVPLLLLVGCQRYEIASTGDRNAAWRLDRWTGEMCVFYRFDPVGIIGAPATNMRKGECKK